MWELVKQYPDAFAFLALVALVVIFGNGMRPKGRGL